MFDLVKQQRYTSNSYSKIAIGGAVNIAIDLSFLPSLECLLVTLEPQPLQAYDLPARKSRTLRISCTYLLFFVKNCHNGS